MNISGSSRLTSGPERRIVYFSDPETVKMLVRFSRPSPSELAALNVILFLMDPIRKMFLAFLDPRLSALERLELAFSSCYRLQYWYWERQSHHHRGEKMDALPFITVPCYDGYLQVNSSSYPLECQKPLWFVR